MIQFKIPTMELLFNHKLSTILNKLPNHLRRGLSYVPKHKPADETDLEKLEEFLNKNDKILLLTGAGISTESGIPDYRSEEVGLYARTNHKPIQYRDFVKFADTRQRYWARNFVGWPRFSQVKPNVTHYAVRDLEKSACFSYTVTQNVDNLHQKAGSEKVIELHGTAFRVMCLGCDYTVDRYEFQETLTSLNPTMKETFQMIRPDGDVELSQEQVENFVVPPCPKCSSPLKPDIVFFGDNVPKQRVLQISEEVSSSDAVLVLGSSLTVYSSYRIVLQAKNEGKMVGIVNIGKTRADQEIDMKISTKCGDLLPKVSLSAKHSS